MVRVAQQPSASPQDAERLLAETPPGSDRPLRRDAERNRRRILDAARELFAQRGLAVTLDDVADHAGLGVGTVYRRFRCRDELVEVLFAERQEQLVSLADEALAESDPWLALSGFLEQLVALQAADRGLKEAMLCSARGRERVARVRELLRPRVEELLQRARAAGALRPEIGVADLPLVQMMLTTVADVAAPQRPDLWRRFLALLLDGMRADGSRRQPLDVEPLSLPALEEAMCRWRPARTLD